VSTTSLETALDPTDPLAREGQTFPQLSDEMAERVAAYGTQESLPAGTVLFQRGERSADFFLVLAGSVEIIETDVCGTPNVVRVHQERQFTGEMNLFNERRTLVSGRARTDCRVVRVRHSDFRRLVSFEPDIGEIIMRAFILRRVALVRHSQAGVELIGPRHGSDTLRLPRKRGTLAGFSNASRLRPQSFPSSLFPGKGSCAIRAMRSSPTRSD
jgi:thioredoxin reductase (NADPH)